MRKNLCKILNGCSITTKQKKRLIAIYLVLSYSKVKNCYFKEEEIGGNLAFMSEKVKA